LLALVRGFPRSARLLKASQFRQVFQRARRVSDQNFTILARANGDQASRLGLAISKKQVRRAVDRNRLKRLVREGFRHHKVALHGLDIVVMARSHALTHSNRELNEALERLWLAVISKPAE
jgi:ribonuclease P protein component